LTQADIRRLLKAQAALENHRQVLTFSLGHEVARSFSSEWNCESVL